MGAQAALSLTFGNFDISKVPLPWGVTALANVRRAFMTLKSAPAHSFTLDWGFDFGPGAKVEVQIGLGPGMALSSAGGTWFRLNWVWVSTTPGPGGSHPISASNFQDVYENTFFGYSPNLYAYTVGVDLKL